MTSGKKKQSKSFFEKIEGEIVSEAEDYINYKTEKVKNRLIKISEISLLIFIGFFLISFGLAAVLATYVPVLSGGFSYLVLGVVFIVISFLLKF